MLTDKGPTVLHFVGSGWDVGGTLSYIRSVTRQNGARNILIVQEGFEQTRHPHMKLLRISKGDYSRLLSPMAIWDSLKQVAWLRRKLVRRHNLIFHGHSRGGVLLGIILSLLGHQRVVVTVHLNNPQRWFYRLGHAVMRDRMIFLCPSMKRYYGLPAENWRDCIPGSVPPSLRRPGKTIPPFFGPETERTLTIGGCGIIVDWKRWEIILEALGWLPTEIRRRVKFIHIGDPLDENISQDYSQLLRDLVHEHHLHEIVEWRGHQNDVKAFFSEIDLLVHPAENEPFGLAVVESLFAGVPVIASDTVGAADLFAPPENGLKFPTNNSRALATMIAELIEGKRAFPQVNRRSLRPLEPDYLNARWAEIYLKLFEDNDIRATRTRYGGEGYSLGNSTRTR
ncbi:glycosyltransferase family 4 protein [Cerasicoccus maritimus]|uniref:glycosyltransferase family 4 protein n=1 Tax=Cerasicoccus maritimus TaxID=490089 RepID=UPI00285281A3|nr:glycosyltransferase family 4 protein [Cerasicoccus maritimus]